MVNGPSITVNYGQEQLRLSGFVPLDAIENMQEHNPRHVHVVYRKDGMTTYKGYGPVMYEEGGGILQVGDDDGMVAYFDENDYAPNMNSDGYMFFNDMNQMGGARRKRKGGRKTRRNKSKRTRRTHRR